MLQSPESTRHHDGDAGVLSEVKKIPVPCYDTGRFRLTGTEQNIVVVRIPANIRRLSVEAKEVTDVSKAAFDLTNPFRRILEPGRQLLGHLFEDPIRDGQLMLSQTVFNEFSARSTGNQTGDPDIGVQEDLLETFSNTSSSVKMPWAPA